MKLAIESARDEVVRGEIEALWKTYAGSVSQIIEAWVTEVRSLWVTSGYEDTDPSKKLVYLIFTEGKDEVVSAFVSADELLKQSPELSRLIPPEFSKISRGANPFEWGEVEDEEWDRFARQRNESLEFDDENDLCSTVYSMDSAAKIAMGYALTEEGVVEFSAPSEYLFEDISDNRYSPDNILSVHARHSEPSRPGAQILRSKCEMFQAKKAGAEMREH